MPVAKLKAWLGLDRTDTPTFAPLRDVVEALDDSTGDAQHLALATARPRRTRDRHVTPRKRDHGLSRETRRIDPEVAVSSKACPIDHLLFVGPADYLVAQEFAGAASYDEKLALARCLFAVAAADESISMAEETEIHRIMNQLRIQPHDLTALRVAHRKFLPGLSGQ